MGKIQKEQSTIVYQVKSGALEIKSDFKKSTIWASQAQIAEIFDIERSVVTKHIRNILSDKELDNKSVCANFAHTGNDGKTYQVQHYNLDIVLSVGYRANSIRAIEFRKWATKILRSYIIDGYAINRNRVAKNYQQFLEAVNDVRKLLPMNANIDVDSILELVNMFASTWLSLDAYDHDALTVKGVTKKQVSLTAEKLAKNFIRFKELLLKKGEASEVFGVEREDGAIAGIVGNIMQTFGDQELYASVEEKASHLLYFIVKDHPFVDGNKRSGAFAFVWFLRQAKIFDAIKITPPALTALTILVAESHPREKEKMIKLILTLLLN